MSETAEQMRARHYREAEILDTLDELRELWMEYPEQRLGQLVANLTRMVDGSTDIVGVWNARDKLIRQRCAIARKTSLGLANAHLHMEQP